MADKKYPQWIEDQDNYHNPPMAEFVDEEDVPAAIELTHNEQFLVDGGVWHAGSTNVSSMSWDYKTKTMTVEFLTGAVYEYYNVSLDVAVGMIETDSPGRYVWNVLRDRYAYKKVQDATGPRRPPQVVRLVNK
jgi:hypothetical protein